MTDQPDFTQIFKLLGTRSNESLEYEIRHLPQMVHDAVFFSSLIHDATFQKTAIKQKDPSVLSIPIKRDRWERYLHTRELSSIASQLDFFGVLTLEVDCARESEDEMMIEYLWIDEDCRIHSKETFTVSIVGEDWRINLSLCKDTFRIALTDQKGDDRL